MFLSTIEATFLCFLYASSLFAGRLICGEALDALDRFYGSTGGLGRYWAAGCRLLTMLEQARFVGA
jgi:hypothetical protein